jgi:hypothetical protein
VDALVDGLGERSVTVGGVLDEAIFEVDNVLGSHVGFVASKGEEVKDVCTGPRLDVGAGPASLNPNFLNASTPSPALGTSQLRTRVRWYKVAAANTATKRNSL